MTTTKRRGDRPKDASFIPRDKDEIPFPSAFVMPPPTTTTTTASTLPGQPSSILSIVSEDSNGRVKVVSQAEVKASVSNGLVEQQETKKLFDRDITLHFGYQPSIVVDFVIAIDDGLKEALKAILEAPTIKDLILVPITMRIFKEEMVRFRTYQHASMKPYVDTIERVFNNLVEEHISMKKMNLEYQQTRKPVTQETLEGILSDAYAIMNDNSNSDNLLIRTTSSGVAENRLVEEGRVFLEKVKEKNRMVQQKQDALVSALRSYVIASTELTGDFLQAEEENLAVLYEQNTKSSGSSSRKQMTTTFIDIQSEVLASYMADLQLVPHTLESRASSSSSVVVASSSYTKRAYQQRNTPILDNQLKALLTNTRP